MELQIVALWQWRYSFEGGTLKKNRQQEEDFACPYRNADKRDI